MAPFVKICATGNDFLLLDGREQSASLDLTQIPHWCHRQRGFGADGMVLLKPHKEHAFEWVFYNSDGGEAELCGNAARAVARYYALKTKQEKFSFLTRVGVIEARVPHSQNLSETVEVQIPKWSEFTPQEGYDFVNTGVPHAVITVSSLSDLKALKSQALVIKALAPFKAKGVNVTFKTPTLSSITFERGVENFTLSCGTGAIAAVVSAEQGRSTFSKRVVEVPGGVLIVEATPNRVLLTGEATVIGTCAPGVFT